METQFRHWHWIEPTLWVAGATTHWEAVPASTNGWFENTRTKRNECQAEEEWCGSVKADLLAFQLRTKWKYSHISPSFLKPTYKQRDCWRKLSSYHGSWLRLVHQFHELDWFQEEAFLQTLFNVSCPSFSKLDYLIFPAHRLEQMMTADGRKKSLFSGSWKSW